MRRRSQLEACMQLAMNRSAYQKIYPRYLVILGNNEGMIRKLDPDAKETCNFRHYYALRNGNLNNKHRLGLTKRVLRQGKLSG